MSGEAIVRSERFKDCMWGRKIVEANK